MNLQVIKNRIRKAFAYSLTAIFFLVIAAFLILQIPPIQNAIVGKLLRNFSNVSGFTTKIENFRLLWFDRLELSGVAILDPEGNRMIGAKSILINFNLAELLNQNDVNIDGVILDSAHVYLTKINESDSSRDLNINIFIYELNQLSKGGSGGKNPKINIGEAVLNQSMFSLVDPDRDSVKQGFDYNHFTLLIDEGQIQNFRVIGDTTEFNVHTLILHDEKTNFPVHELSTFFRISQTSMEFTGLNLRAGQSFIQDTVIFSYKTQRDLRDFIRKVKIHARLDSTIVHPQDLALFAPGTERIERPVLISGEANGYVNNFSIQSMDARVGKTRFVGSLEMEGLPDINETFIFLNVSHSRIDFNDLDFLFNETTLSRLTPFGLVTFNGQFTGYATDFVAHGNFDNRLGNIRSDINVKVNDENIDQSTYSGRLSMTNFDLGTYLNDTTLFQKVTLDGHLSGSGLTKETANFKLSGKVNTLGFKGYNYTNIVTDAHFAAGFFSGKMTIDDPNLQISATGSVDLRKNRNLINIEASLDTALVHNLKLSDKELFFSGTLDVDIKGLELDSLVGIANINDFTVIYQDEEMFLKNIYLNAQRKAGKRIIFLETTLLDVFVEGNYEISYLTRDIPKLLHEISLNVENNEETITAYYAQKRAKPQNYQASFQFTIKDLMPVTDLLDLDLTTSRNTLVEGSFTSGYTTIFQAYTSIDTLRYQKNNFLDTDAELTVSKIADSTNVLAIGVINSQKQILKSGLSLENLMAEGVWNKSHIGFQFDGEEPTQGNYVRLKGTVDFLKDSTKIKFLPSAIHLLERDWNFEPSNAILIRDKEWQFRNLEIMNEQQSVRLHGFLSDDESKALNLNVNDLDLSILNVISKTKFSGTLNANAQVQKYFTDPSVENDLTIDSLTINEFLVGNVNGKNEWDSQAKRFDLNLFIDRNLTRIVNLTGSYTPGLDEPLDVTANLDNANLKLLEPLLTDIFSEMDGTVTGSFKITGDLNDPKINGEGMVNNGQLLVNYTRTLYKITGIIGLEPNLILFKDLDVADPFRNKGKLTGSITHQAFNKMVVDIKASFRNFQVLNTTPKDNSLFYGQAYATGDVRFFGPVQKLNITSSARTDKNTRLFIPVGGSGNTEQEEFINFVSFNNTVEVAKTNQKKNDRVDLTGITFDLNLDVTPDAYCEIIFDLKAGDIIRGRGNGDIKLQVDTKGEFNMFGAVEFTEGWYNFTLYNIINKEFEIKKGSRITWYGDPYGAIMNIDAAYNQLASLAPLVANSENLSTSPELKRKYPIQVLLKLEGQMLSPDITFDILADDLPQATVSTEVGVSLDFIFSSFKAKLDEQELKKQVFSLIVLRKFAPLESGINTSGTLYNSVSELLSNQLSSWMSQVDENLEIDVDLGTMDQDAFNAFQLRLSYTFLSGRLRVTRDGTFGNQDYANAANQSSVASLAGDWTVDYFLTPDGKFKVKMYNRTNYNQLNTSLNNQSYFTTGVSLQHVQSFNEFKDLVKFARKGKESTEKKEEEEPKAPTPNEEAKKDDDDEGL
jgi:hypothetical protein